jgi:outer membrane protein assembly factor BamB
LGAAIAAGVFSVAVGVEIVAHWMESQRWDPFDSQELARMREEALKESFSDAALVEKIRGYELSLRQEYYHRQAFARWGGWLLLGGVVVFLSAVKYAADCRKEAPRPAGGAAPEEAPRTAAAGRWAVGAVALALVGATVAAIVYFVPATPTEGPAGAAATYPKPEEIARQWPRFRGPGGAATSAYANIPTKWNGKSGEGILWKTPVPLPGRNSPVVWGDAIFLTGATETKREVYCFDARSGRLRWQRPVETPEGKAAPPPKVEKKAGYAAPTAVTDGRRVAAIFANGDVAAFDFEGKPLWARSLGVPKNTYGHAASLVLYRNMVLVPYDQGRPEDRKSRLFALDAATGKTLWEALRPVSDSWTTPIVIEAGGAAQVVTAADPWVIAYNPLTGAEVWRAKCLRGDVAPSPVFADGVVYVVNTGADLVAIRADGQGDVTKSHILWRSPDNLPDVISPLAGGGLVWTLLTYGTLTCYDARDGRIVYEHDLDAAFWSSPSLVGDSIYLTSEKGVTFIVSATREFKELGRSELGENAYASPAFLDGRIYVRGEKHLFAIGNPKE